MAKFNLKLTKDQQKMVVAAVLGLGGLGYVYVAILWMPISSDIAKTEKAIDDVDAKIDKATREAARLPHLETELVQLNEQAVEAERRLPKKKETTDILVTVTELAEKNDVLLLSFTPGAPNNKSGATFSELNYPLTIKGRFHNIGKFLASLALEERIFNVQNVSYGSAGEDGEMTVNLTLISYQYKG